MTYEELEETQRRQITQALLTDDERNDMILAFAHINFWKESRFLGYGPCWQWPHVTAQALAARTQ